eukprot:CAMPEP_0176025070 /NCGR_PEP_ID=MMETSP0120_2-20121206/12259_1 /TAXON_ID=160619 /ORGANISM="Kryptoperidinium foliaceum, Strain CCMP 1326" /LENGTH=218 /DNA_ID=CAMNT_0017358251 /DNA_START=1 /DNA_END=660 /DNA_ORIENTATION=+
MRSAGPALQSGPSTISPWRTPTTSRNAPRTKSGALRLQQVAYAEENNDALRGEIVRRARRLVEVHQSGDQANAPHVLRLDALEYETALQVHEVCRGPIGTSRIEDATLDGLPRLPGARQIQNCGQHRGTFSSQLQGRTGLWRTNCQRKHGGAPDEGADVLAIVKLGLATPRLGLTLPALAASSSSQALMLVESFVARAEANLWGGLPALTRQRPRAPR